MISWDPELSTDGKPRYLAIADAVARDLAAGVLKPGDRLPPQRQLAERLSMDFTTISRGYAEAQKRGLVKSHVGRGTFVSHATILVAEPDPLRARDEDLAMNMPPEPRDEQLIRRMRSGLDYVGANLVPLLRYQSPLGSDRDRTTALAWLTERGLSPQQDRVAITPGAHATMVAILSILSEPGNTILCESVTYPGLRTIAARLHLKLVGLPMDAEGIDPSALDHAIREHEPKALYLTPTLHNPTTLTIPASRRTEIATVMRQHGLNLIEDDAYGFIPLNSPDPIACSVPELTWYVGGLSKCLGAGLRLAYTAVPSSRCALALGHALRSTAVMASPISSALVTRWIDDGTAEAIRRFIRSESAARQAIAVEVLSGFNYRSHPNAFNIWLCLPEGSGRADLMGRMGGRHIGIMPSDAFTVLGPPDEHVRVGLGGSITRDELRRAMLFMANSLGPNDWAG
ncbi:PLP-dependent aminotransferase family protein [Pararhodobacter sp. SW119]|uniref:aminotransferase-like domain-containing protein n=1 Tax=Pararhodobacter sp. SW119 TaxID=2780075 RepID=UPI001AE04A5C|nr:PLP-dependent aminotransferase family protein [Pararhodobacter sp. SW119]